MYHLIKENLSSVNDSPLADLLHYQETVVQDCIENAQGKASSEGSDISQCEGLYFAFELYRAFAHELQERNHQKLNHIIQRNDGKETSESEVSYEDKTFPELVELRIEAIEGFKENQPELALEHYKELAQQAIKYLKNRQAA